MKLAPGHSLLAIAAAALLAAATPAGAAAANDAGAQSPVVGEDSHHPTQHSAICSKCGDTCACIASCGHSIGVVLDVTSVDVHTRVGEWAEAERRGIALSEHDYRARAPPHLSIRL